jgi:hypothetical protein
VNYLGGVLVEFVVGNPLVWHLVRQTGVSLVIRVFVPKFLVTIWDMRR